VKIIFTLNSTGPLSSGPYWTVGKITRFIFSAENTYEIR
jgi:hypothetical protein